MFLSIFAALAQLVEHPHGKGKVMGSCPIGGSIRELFQKKWCQYIIELYFKLFFVVNFEFESSNLD